MPEWRPGVLEGLLREIGTTGQASQRKGMLTIAAAIEAAAKADLSKTSHRYNEPSPAAKGGPPSLVSGTLRRSITHQEVGTLRDIDIKVGTAAGVYPPARPHKSNRRRKGSGRSTPASKYGWYQETLARFNHPFLKPAFRRVVGAKAVDIWLASFRKWPRLR